MTNPTIVGAGRDRLLNFIPWLIRKFTGWKFRIYVSSVRIIPTSDDTALYKLWSLYNIFWCCDKFRDGTSNCSGKKGPPRVHASCLHLLIPFVCRDFFAGALGQVLSVASPTESRVRCSRVVSRGSSYRNAENCYEHLSLKMKLITLLLPCLLNTICLSAIDASNRHVRLVLLSFCLPLFL